MGAHNRHHTVAEGLQRHWSWPGKRIALINKAKLTAKPVGIHDAFVIPKLLTFQTPEGPSNELETAFGAVENKVLPHVRRFIDGARDPASDTAVNGLLSLHWARSQSIVDVHRRILREVTAELAEVAETDSDLLGAFQRSHGRPPHPGEIRQIIVAHSELWRRANNLFADRVQQHYNRALEFFGSKHLQRIEIAHHSVEFLLADSPVTLFGGLGRLHGTATRPCPLFDGEALWFPLSPFVGVSLNEQPVDDLRIAPADAQRINLDSWRYAKAYLAARLDADIDRALARPPGTITRVR